jgi:CBS domain-containing protein
MPNTPSTVKDFMRSNPLTILQDASLVQAIEIIVEYKLTGLTVTDENGRAVGVLSELDCIQTVLAAIYNDGDPEHALVSDAMTTDLKTCSPSDGIVEVANDMLQTRQRRRPVLVDGKLVGQVSSSNVLWALMEHSRRNILKQ